MAQRGRGGAAADAPEAAREHPLRRPRRRPERQRPHRRGDHRVVRRRRRAGERDVRAALAQHCGRARRAPDVPPAAADEERHRLELDGRGRRHRLALLRQQPVPGGAVGRQRGGERRAAVGGHAWDDHARRRHRHRHIVVRWVLLAEREVCFFFV